MNLIILVIYLCLVIGSSTKLNTELNDITFLILSQKNKYHSGIAEGLQKSIIEQSLKLKGKNKNSANVYLSHRIFDEIAGAWAITPVLTHLVELLEERKWLVICEDQSVVNVALLLENLNKENPEDDIYLSYPLFDRETTIIHHFSQFENGLFYYPFMRAGCIFSVGLLKLMANNLANYSLTTDFFIDGPYEMALYIRNRLGINLTHASYLCKQNTSMNCAIFPNHEYQHSSVDNSISLNKILIAVKTCRKYHDTRIPLVMETWGRYVSRLRFFSDIADPGIPTISTNITNTETGHCEKSIQIFNLILNELSSQSTSSIEWIFLVDDDTTVGVASLLRYLSNFNYREDFYLGERYGYHLLSNTGGLNYITGGGGIILSVRILKNLAKACSCPLPSSPDDMIIAACLQRLDVVPIHSSSFHQARPNDYTVEILTQETISFHKHWQINVKNMYSKWFERDDQIMFKEFEKKVLKIKSQEAKLNCLDGLCSKNLNKVQHTDL